MKDKHATNIGKKLKFSIAMISALVLVMVLSGILIAQTQVMVRKAELAVPFGTISGKLVFVSDQMVFVDEDRPEDSFAITRAEISDFKTDNDIVNVTTRRAIRVRSEEKSQFSFRLREGTPEALSLWAGAKTTAANTAAAASGKTETSPASSEKEQKWVYNARHPHMFGLGSCTGKLIITRERLVYESLDNREHTRQWPLIDIKRVKRASPYKIEIDTFNRDDYTLELEGQGMDIDVQKMLDEWISLSRQKP